MQKKLIRLTAFGMLLCLCLVTGCTGTVTMRQDGISSPADEVEVFNALPEAIEDPDTTLESLALRNETPLDEEGTIATNAQYRQTYSDYQAAQQWLADNITNSAAPPISFTLDGVHSNALQWTKTVGTEQTITDYPNDNPVQRKVYTITYTCDAADLEVKMDVTSYPNYPVVEYEAYIYNTAEGDSGEIQDVLAIDSVITQNGSGIIHAMNGCTNMVPGQFRPIDTELGGDGESSVSYSVDNGKPTSSYLPNFNFQTPNQKSGVISVLSWQGNWKATFTASEEGVRMTGGQLETDFVMHEGESFRVPLMVLLFYKGDNSDGQNIYRRWLYEHNYMRMQGIRKTTNALVCIGGAHDGMKSLASDDMAFLNALKTTSIGNHLDYFNQDAGWYECDPNDWVWTGNWYPDADRYPNTLKQVSDAAHENGMGYSLWLEPERLYSKTQMADELGAMDEEYLLAVDSNNNYVPYTEVLNNVQVLANYSKPEVVDYVVDLLDTVIKEQGVDQYRQDFNILPAKFWKAYDAYITAKDGKEGAPRVGITENFYTTGYLRLFEELLELHPGLEVDACASGAMRHDLATLRFSFSHTRTDFYHDPEDEQCATWGYSNWYMLWGSAMMAPNSDYDMRSRINTSMAIAVDVNNEALTIQHINTWKNLASYALYDYYPLTTYSESDNSILAYQYNDPESGRGMACIYIRSGGVMTVYPRGLVSNAQYRIWSLDNPDAVGTYTGAQLMTQGLNASASGKTALVYQYERVD